MHTEDGALPEGACSQGGGTRSPSRTTAGASCIQSDPVCLRCGIVYVLACLAEGLGIRATARDCEIDPHTVMQWLVEAAEHLGTFSASFLCDVYVKQVQLGELCPVLCTGQSR